MCVILTASNRSTRHERQLLYGASRFPDVADCQLRVIDELATGGPHVEFGITD
jgi:hypothetical protein